MVINFYGHIWQHHHELINPDDGTVQENAIIELQDNRTVGQRSNRQEVSDKASIKTNQETKDVEHTRAAKPAQDGSCEQKSDHQKVSNPERKCPTGQVPGQTKWHRIRSIPEQAGRHKI